LNIDGPAISKVDCKLPRAVLVELRDLCGCFDVADDLDWQQNVRTKYQLTFSAELGNPVP